MLFLLPLHLRLLHTGQLSGGSFPPFSKASPPSRLPPRTPFLHHSPLAIFGYIPIRLWDHKVYAIPTTDPVCSDTVVGPPDQRLPQLYNQPVVG